MNSYQSLREVVDSAIATDGGSICLRFAEESGVLRSFTLNRAIRDIGTPRFNQIQEGDNHILSQQQRQALLEQLRRLLIGAPEGSVTLVQEFINHMAPAGA